MAYIHCPVSLLTLEPRFAGVWIRGGRPKTLKFEPGLDFLTMHQTIKFYHPIINRSEVLVLTDKQTKNKQSDSVENICLAPLCYYASVKKTDIATDFDVVDGRALDCVVDS